MKLRSYVAIFITVLSTSFFLASCLNEENKIPPNCYDGVLNNGENPSAFVGANGAVLFDCGGPCVPCDHCHNGIFEPWEDEEWKDCGGPDCEPCQPCANGVLDNGEEAIDCGATACDYGCDLLCGDGLLNGYEAQIDCIDVDDPNPAAHGTCDYCPTCDDGIMNGDEKGIDCGGTNPNCVPCCVSGSCTNGYIDGNEFNTNCGGSTCYDCDSSLVWKIGTKSYFTPNNMIIKAQTPTSLSFNICTAIEVGDDLFLPVGQMTIMITMPTFPVAGWTNGAAISFPTVNNTAANYYINWNDTETGFEYSTSNTNGTGVFVMEKVATVVIPNNPLDGCNKPAGTYDYYRGSFTGNLKQADSTLPGVTCSLGHFEVTFYTP
jgi:hypothetical protein